MELYKYKCIFQEATKVPTFLHYPLEIPKSQFTQGLGQASFLTQEFMTQLDHPSCSGHPTGKCQDSGLYLTRKLPEGSVPWPPGDSHSPLYFPFTTLLTICNYMIIYL